MSNLVEEFKKTDHLGKRRVCILWSAISIIHVFWVLDNNYPCKILIFADGLCLVSQSGC